MGVGIGLNATAAGAGNTQSTTPTPATAPEPAPPIVLVYSKKTAALGETPNYDATVVAAKMWLNRYFRCDIITELDVEKGKLETSNYKVAILPDNAVMSAAEVKAWQKFAAGGGKILAAALTSTRNEKNSPVPMQLGDLLGVWYEQSLASGTYQQILVTQDSMLSRAGVAPAIQVQGPAYLVDPLENGTPVAVRANAEGTRSLIYPSAVVESPAGLYFGLPIFNPQVLAWPDLQQMLYQVLAYLAPAAVKADFTPVSRQELFQAFFLISTDVVSSSTADSHTQAMRVVDQIPGEVPPAASYQIFPGAYYRKAVSSFDVWTGIEGVITLPQLITDPDRQRDQGPLDNASIYMGGNGSGQEIDAGLTWDNNVGGWRPFWRNESWHNAPLDKDLYVWYPGETVRMSVAVAGPGQLRLTIVDAGPEPKKAFTTVFRAWGFGPGVRQQFKRVNAIDQVGNEGRPVQPTHARVTRAVWSEVWLLRGDVKVPFTAQRFTDMRAPTAEHFVITTPANGGPGAESIEIYGTPADIPRALVRVLYALPRPVGLLDGGCVSAAQGLPDEGQRAVEPVADVEVPVIKGFVYVRYASGLQALV